MIAFRGRTVGLTALIALTAGAGLSACGGTPPPRSELRAAEVAIEEARESDAEQHASSPLSLARDKLSRARAAVDRGDMASARRLSEEAEVDAQYAEAEALSEKAQARVAQLRESIEVLQEEIERARPKGS